MLRFRSSLALLKEEDGVFFVQDSNSLAIYEFEKQEYFLLEALAKPYNETVLVAKYNAKFSEKISLHELQTFISKLADLGLLQEDDEVNASNPHNVEISANPKQLAPKIGSNNNINSTYGNEQKAEPTAQHIPHNPQHWHLFCPQRLLDSLLNWFGAFRYLKRLVPIIFIFSLFGFFINLSKFSTDLQVVKTNTNFLVHIIFTLFTTNLVTQIFRGVVARNFNLQTPSFGIILFFGLIPRFNIQIDTNEDTPKLAKLWVAAGSIYVLLVLFSLATIIWLTFRNQGTVLSYAGTGLTLVSIVAFFFVINPLMGGPGNQLISEYYNAPNLRKDAFRALRYIFFKPPEVVKKYTKDSAGLRMYAICSILFLGLFIVFLGTGLAKWLKLHYSGLGISIFLILVFYLLRRLYIKSFVRKTKPKNAVVNARTERKVTLKNSAISNVLLRLKKPYSVYLLIAIVLFLPYRYESGGTVEIFPVSTQKIYVEYSGISNEVYYDGGEWLHKGTVIAVMDNAQQSRNVDVTKAEINKKQEEINLLLTTPLKEEVDLAEQHLLIAKLHLQYSKENLQRIKTLYDKKYISFDTFQSAEEKMEIDRQESIEKEIDLRAIKNQVNSHLIQSLEIELSILERELIYYQKILVSTQLSMPIDGRIVTMNLKNQANKYFKDGDLFAEVEDARRMRVEIWVPESDINEVALGSHIKLRLQTFPNHTIQGTIADIYPTTTEGAVGNVVKAVSLIDNQGHLLKSGMTGYAKIEGRQMFVIEAFSRALVRFFQVEAWSWLP